MTVTEYVHGLDQRHRSHQSEVVDSDDGFRVPASPANDREQGRRVIGYGDEPFPDRLFPAGHGHA